MRFEEWEPEYVRILREFRFERRADEATTQALVRELARSRGALLGHEAEEVLRSLLRGKDALLVGGGPGPLPLPPSASVVPSGPRVVVAADGATSNCLAKGTVPDLIVTDLDGKLPDEVEANRRGALVLAHAHGDNLPAVRTWVSRFPGRIAGTCAGAPAGGLLNPGGFTDGDRCLFVAEEFGARSALLVGYDFEHPQGEPAATLEVKRRKLAVARRLVRQVAARGNLRVEVLGPDGRVRPAREA